MIDIHNKPTDGLELFRNTADTSTVLTNEKIPDKMFAEKDDEFGGQPDDTQCEMVLKHMKDCGSITPLDAIREFGILRLGARIFQLREAGYRIETDTEESINRYGKTIRYARYRLA